MTVTISNYWLWPMFVLCVVYSVAIIANDVLKWKIRKLESEIRDRLPKP